MLQETMLWQNHFFFFSFASLNFLKNTFIFEMCQLQIMLILEVTNRIITLHFKGEKYEKSWHHTRTEPNKIHLQNFNTILRLSNFIFRSDEPCEEILRNARCKIREKNVTTQKLECTLSSVSGKIRAHHLRNAYTFENTFEGTTWRITTPRIPLTPE